LFSAKELAHKIKGASGTIGAVRLYAASEALEAELKKGLSAAAFDSFQEAFDQTMSIIAALPQPVDPISPSTGDSAALLHNAMELNQLLKENDFISDALLNAFKSHLTSDQLDIFAQLRKLINNLQYDEARKILQQLTGLSDPDGT
jgi:HPt (histidine-containing phosphotransfer) domain-containing protein